VSPEEIARRASELREKMTRQFVCAPVHLIETLQLLEELAKNLPKTDPLSD
jgi:hypothetical protein